jgi:MFS family permease
VPEVPVSRALRSRLFWTLVIVVFGGTIATNGALVHLVALLSDRGVPADQAALSVSAMAGAGLVGRVVTGWLLDRFAAARVSVVLLLIAAAGTFALSAAESFAVGLIASICLGFGSGGETDIVPYLIARHFGLRSLSTLYGFNWTAWGLAGIAGPLLLGRAFDETGSYALAMTQLGVITLVAAALMLTFPQLSPAKAER